MGWNRISWRLVGPCLASCLLAGCPSGKDADPQKGPRPAATADVAVAVPAGLGLADAWQVAAAEWEVSTGAQSSIQEVPVSSQGRPPESADLAVMPLAELATLLDAGWLATIDDRSPVFAQTQDLLPGLRRAISQSGGRSAGLPLASPVLACYYRADLLEAAGKSPPASWTEYRQLVETLPEWAPGLSAVEPWSEEFRSTMFLARSVSAALHPDNFSLYLDVESGEVLIDKPPFVAALDDASALLQQLDPRSLELSPVDCVNELLAGRAALAIGAPEALFPLRQRTADAQQNDSIRVGVAPLPGAERVYHVQTGDWRAPTNGTAVQRVTLIGFDGLIVCAAAGREPLVRTSAWGLWNTLDSPDLVVGERPWSSAVVSPSRLTDVLRQPLPGFGVESWRAHVQAAADSLNLNRTVLDLPLPERDRFRTILTDHVSQALAQEATAAEALAAVRGEWEQLIDELGRRRVVNIYRLSSGLSPLAD